MVAVGLPWLSAREEEPTPNMDVILPVRGQLSQHCELREREKGKKHRITENVK